MFFLVIFLVCLWIALGAGFLSALSDMRGLIIPNIYSVIVALSFVAAYGAHWFLGGGDIFSSISSHLLGALIVFSVTLVLFATGVMGAADSKLGSAYALWIGLEGLLPFLVYVTLAGGVLALLSLLFRVWWPFQAPIKGSWVAELQAGKSKVPYGVAIFFGALASFLKLGYIGVGSWGVFLLS